MKQSSLGITVPVYTGGETGNFFKSIGKVVWILIPQVVANLGNGVVGVCQFRFGVVHFGLDNKLFDRDVGPFLEIGSQIFFVVTEVVRDVGNFQVAADIQFDVVCNVVVELTAVAGAVVSFLDIILGTEFGQNHGSDVVIQASHTVAAVGVLQLFHQHHDTLHGLQFPGNGDVDGDGVGL